ncbi:MAG: DUF3473 domain-containing protein [Planctomycetes bacterium]|nr:DUF3473 domain-containing protein [Planctomycetota bacterium]
MRAGLNVLTVDVEDYFHVQAFADQVSPRTWAKYSSRVVQNTHRVLRLLKEHDVQATFFVLGWVADRFPRLVRDILDDGHEIGCHSFFHRLIYELTPDEFREDLLMATKAIGEITGGPVQAYRAPSFSVTNRSLWALDVLIDEGYRYDSSIFPIRHDHYGLPGAERFPHLIERSHGALWEFPPSTIRLGRWNVPVAGGGYLRLYPLRLSLRWMDQLNRVERQPFLCYVHPWELDPEQPRLPGRWKSRWRHYQNLRTTQRKLQAVLSRYRFAPLGDVLKSCGIEKCVSFDEAVAERPLGVSTG